ncbi:MAG TPA: GDSL-type esterase/lipase family protein [Abditibacteriaceae bacterium]|nr:GDSL-type esterase/lipase family protein [Abditibacteriaceae bacterium]
MSSYFLSNLTKQQMLKCVFGCAYATLLLNACERKTLADTVPASGTRVSKTTNPSTAATASYGPWKSAPIGGGGYLQQVVFAPSDAKRMYMTSDVGGLFRSDNGGQTWRMLHGSLPPDAGSYSVRGIAVHPRDANRVLVGLGNAWGKVKGVWLTTDGGASWQKKFDAAFEANGWHRSTGNVVVMSPHNPNFIVAAPLGGGIAHSSDGGQSWQSSGPDDLSATHILFDRTNAQRIWACGREWGEYKVKRADGTETGLRGGLYLSEDMGKSWTKINEESPGEMLQDPKNPAVLWGLLNEKQVVRSTDKGVTWVRHSQGLPAKGGGARDDGTYEALAAGPDFLLLGGQGGHFYRLDGDWKTWKKIEPAKIEEGNWWGRMEKFRHFGSALGYIGINPRDTKHWVFTDWYALYQTRDAGKTWKLTVDGVEMTVLNTVAQEPTNAQVFHTGMADIGYFRSRDGGRSTEQFTKDISSNIKCIAPAPGQPGRIYATGPRGWEWQANELFISDDTGLTWRRSGLSGIPDMENRRSETVAPHPAKKDEVWITVSGTVKAGEGGPWRSLDAGKTWTWQGAGLPQDGEFFHKSYWVAGPELAISPDGSMIATSDDRGLMARRGPNETSWTMVKVPAGGPNCVAADVLRPGRFYVAMKEGGLWRTDDGGKSWKNLVERDVFWVSPDMTKPGRVAVTTQDSVLVSNDEGATWREMSRALPYRHPRNVVCFAGENVVVGTGGNGVFHAPLSSLQGAATSRALKTTQVNDITKEVSTQTLPLQIAANDARLRYVGRFDMSDKSAPRAAWSASTIALRFRGTDANVRLRGSNNDRWQIEVDGQPTTKLKIQEGRELYRVASGLKNGEHTIRLIKATEALFGHTRVLGWQLNRGAQVLPLAVPSRRLEVIGDSISAGYGNEASSKEERFSPDTENAYFTYGAIAARDLGADYVCVAWSGKKMWPDNTLPELYDRTIPTEENSRWDFKNPAPDAVLINLATNDFGSTIPDEAGWTKAYGEFVARVRRNYPRAQIYCAIGPMMGDWGEGKPLSTLRRYLAKIVANRTAAGDARVKIIDFGSQDANNGFGADWHPNVKTNRIMAAQLSQTLRKDLKW